MKNALRKLTVVVVLGILARPAAAQQVTAQTQQGEGAWCQKCAVPGVCIGTASGEWGYTICQGLGGNQCAAGGHTCMWSTGAMNAAAAEVHLASGQNARMTPMAPFVWTAADCDEGSLLAVADPTDGLVRADAGADAWRVMTLAAR